MPNLPLAALLSSAPLIAAGGACVLVMPWCTQHMLVQLKRKCLRRKREVTSHQVAEKDNPGNSTKCSQPPPQPLLFRPGRIRLRCDSALFTAAKAVTLLLLSVGVTFLPRPASEFPAVIDKKCLQSFSALGGNATTNVGANNSSIQNAKNTLSLIVSPFLSEEPHAQAVRKATSCWVQSLVRLEFYYVKARVKGVLKKCNTTALKTHKASPCRRKTRQGPSFAIAFVASSFLCAAGICTLVVSLVFMAILAPTFLTRNAVSAFAMMRALRPARRRKCGIIDRNKELEGDDEKASGSNAELEEEEWVPTRGSTARSYQQRRRGDERPVASGIRSVPTKVELELSSVVPRLRANSKAFSLGVEDYCTHK